MRLIHRLVDNGAPSHIDDPEVTYRLNLPTQARGTDLNEPAHAPDLWFERHSLRRACCLRQAVYGWRK